MSNCPYCGSDVFIPYAKEITLSSGAGYINTCNLCGKRSIFEEATGEQHKAEEYPDWEHLNDGIG